MHIETKYSYKQAKQYGGANQGVASNVQKRKK
jgi:hypothetical protein